MAPTFLKLLAILSLGAVVNSQPGKRLGDGSSSKLLGLPFGKTTYEESIANADNHNFVVIQNRKYDASPQFETNGWNEYANGFGSEGADAGYWLGLNRISQATSAGRWQLLMRYTLNDGTTSWFLYDDFRVGTSTYNYALTLGSVREVESQISLGSNVVSTLMYMNGAQFSTHDRDDDDNCAKSRKGGWWFRSCAYYCANCMLEEFQSRDWGASKVKEILMAMRRTPSYAH